MPKLAHNCGRDVKIKWKKSFLAFLGIARNLIHFLGVFKYIMRQMVRSCKTLCKCSFLSFRETFIIRFFWKSFFLKMILVNILWNCISEKSLVAELWIKKLYRPIRLVKYSKFSISLTTCLFKMICCLYIIRLI